MLKYIFNYTRILWRIFQVFCLIFLVAPSLLVYGQGMQTVYFSKYNAIERIGENPDNFRQIIQYNFDRINKIAVDTEDGFIFFIDREFSNRSVWRSDLDGGNKKLIESLGSYSGIAVDAETNTLFFSRENSGLIRSDYQGNNREQIVIMDDITDLAIDTKNKRVYWELSKFSEEDDIMRSDFNGDFVALVINDANEVSDIAIDNQRNLLWWADPSEQSLFQSNLDGGSIISYTSGLITDGIVQIEVHESTGNVYFTDTRQNAVIQFDLSDNILSPVLREDEGDLVVWDGTDIAISSSLNTIYSSSDKKIIYSSLLGENINDVVSGIEDDVSDIYTDLSNKKLYWIEEVISGTDMIRRSDLDGGNLETIKLPGRYPVSVVVDERDETLYYIDADFEAVIYKVNLNDMSSIEIAREERRLGFSDLAIDTLNNKLWVSSVQNHRIQNLNLDGTLRTTIIDNNNNHDIRQIALDVDEGKVFWTEKLSNGDRVIKSANYDGTNLQTTVSFGLENPSGLTYSETNNKLWWVDSSRDNISNFDLISNTTTQTFQFDGLEPSDIALGLPFNNPPEITGEFPNDFTIIVNETDSLKMWDYFEDIETPDSLLSFEFNSEPSGLTFTYNKSTGYLLVKAGTQEGEYEALITATDEAGLSVNGTLGITVNLSTSISDREGGIPEKFSISQNYPNPFNPTTQIQYALPQASDVKLEIYNMIGQRVSSVVNKRQTAGVHTATFDASSLSSGVYIYRIVAGDFTQTKKMLLIK